MIVRTSRFYKLLIGSAFLLTGIGMMLWFSIRDSAQKSPVPDAASQPVPGGSAPWQLSRSTSSAKADSLTPRQPPAGLPKPAAPPAANAAGKTASPPHRGLPASILAGKKGASEDSTSSPEGEFRRVSLYETDFKYPLLRLEEQIHRDANGQEIVSKWNVMVADHFMVQLKHGIEEAAFLTWLEQNQLTVRRRLPNSPVYLVAISNPSIAAYDHALQAFADEAGPAEHAEPDYVVQNHDQASPPNDPSFAQLWNLNNTGQTGGAAGADVNALTAWAVTTGSNNVVIGVIDSGMDLTHPDLVANLWTNPGEIPGDGLDNDGNGYVDDVHGWNFVKGNNDPNDDNGHGSHTSGTVGATGGNGIGVTGVCQHVKIMPLKFLDAGGSGTDSDAIEAIYYATAKGVLLTSNSWGGGDNSAIMKGAIDHAGLAGVGFIAAAGNDGLDNDVIPSYPANYACANLISVAATDASDQLAWFSNYGSNTVHLAAPGEEVFSTYKDGGYAFSSGTSMATPHVSGAAALLKAANPSMSFAQIKAALLAKTDALPSLTGKTATGGRLDVGNAIDLAEAAYPIVVASTVHDDTGGETVGNGDGIISPGETVAVTLKVQNLGGFATGPLQGTLALKTADSKVTLTHTTLSFGVVGPSVKADNAEPSLLITVAADHATPASIPLTLTLTDGNGVNRTEDLTLNLYTIATISGRVTSVTGNNGLENATIHLAGTVSKNVTTAVDGTYTATVVNGTYAVHASAMGYVPSVPQSVTVPPSVANVNMVLGFSELEISGTPLMATVQEGASATKPLTLTNHGDVPLTWKLEEIPAPTLAPTSLGQQLSGISPALRPAFLPQEHLPQSPEEGPGSGRKLPPRPTLKIRDNNTAPYATLPFADGFEDGTSNKWFESWTDAFREVVTDTAAEGNKSFRFNLAGPDDHFSGVHQEFVAGSKPGHVSFWTRTEKRDMATAYMVMVDASNGYLVDFIWFFAHPNGRFYINADVGGNQLVAYEADRWYQIEFRNINWTTKTFDYVVDGQVVQASIPFRNPSVAKQCIAAFAYNYSSNVNAWWDDVHFSADALDWLQLSNKSGTIPPGQSTTITVTLDAARLLAAEYPGALKLTTNDPNTPAATLPVTLTVTPAENHVPVANATTIQTDEDSPTVFNLGGSDDDAGATLTYYITQLPSHGRLFQTDNYFNITVPITTVPTQVTNSSQLLYYVPESNEHGSPYTAFQFTVRDQRSESAPATVTVNVSSVPDAPVTSPDVAAIMPGQSLPVLAVLANDYSPENLPLSLKSFTQPAGGTVASNGDGTLSFIPHPDFLSNSTSFTYTATDGAQDATATVTVNIGSLRGGIWPTLGRDSQRSGFYPTIVDSPLQLRWSQSMSGVPTSPVVADNLVYVTAHLGNESDEIKAFDLPTGLPRWSSTETISQGINSPLWYNGTLYYVLTDPGYSSSINALSATNGARKWTGTFPPTQSEYGKSLLASHGYIHMAGGQGPKLYGIYPDQVLATYITTLPGAQTGTATEAANLIVTATGGALHALDPVSGALRWSFRPKPSNLTANATVTWQAGDAVVNLDGQLHCVSTVQTPVLRWSSAAPDNHLFTPMLAWGRIYSAVSGTTPAIKAYDRSTGNLLQSYPLPAVATAQPLATQDSLIVPTASETLIIRLADGSVMQTLPKTGMIVAADNTLVIVNATNRTVDAYGARPVIAVHPGTSSAPTSISAMAGTTIPEGEIHYTTDGSQPTSGSPLLANLTPLRFLRTTTFKAVGIHAGITGLTTTATFNIMDANANGLPDWWEQQYGSLRAVPVGSLNPALDDDGDGRSNLDEFIAGTDPNVADAVVTSVQSASGSGPTLSWASQEGRFYTVRTSQDLKTWDAATNASHLPGTGSTMTWQDNSTSSLPRKFYRVAIEVP